MSPLAVSRPRNPVSELADNPFVFPTMNYFPPRRTSAMPKMKTHKASKKRFRVSANGKLLRSQAGKKHLNSPKSGKRKRHLRGRVAEEGRMANKYVKMMGEVP
jgi:large subunit ribosomal protein L35